MRSILENGNKMKFQHVLTGLFHC